MPPQVWRGWPEPIKGYKFETRRGVTTNIRLLTWPAAGFLMGFGAPIRDETAAASTLGVLVLSTFIGLLFAAVGLVAALIAGRRAEAFVSRPFVLLILAFATVSMKLVEPNGFSLVPAALFVWFLRTRTKAMKDASLGRNDNEESGGLAGEPAPLGLWDNGGNRMSVKTYVLVLLVASFLGTVWMTTDPFDSVLTALLVWSGPAALAGILSVGRRNYYVWPSILWLFLFSSLWIGTVQNATTDNQNPEHSVPVPASAASQSTEPGSVYVFVSRESSEGVSQDALTVEALPRIEARSLEMFRRHMGRELETTGKRWDPETLEAESVIIELGPRKLAVTRFKAFNVEVAAQFLGIIDGELVRVACATDNPGGLVLNKGVCNDKIKEVFGVLLRPNDDGAGS